MTTPTSERPDEPLISGLRTLHRANDRGSLAALRAWWSPTTRHRAWPVLGRLIRYQPDQHAPAYYLPDQITAALFAVHCRQELLHDPDVPLGRCCLKLAGGSQKAPGFEAFERHFRRLLTCESLEELGDQLHTVIKRAEREGAALNYNQLLLELRRWNSDRDEIKTRWAIHFWQAPSELQPTVSDK